MSTAELTTYTADDLLGMPEGDRYELVQGELVEIRPMGGRAGWIAGQLHSKLNEYSRRGENGRAFLPRLAFAVIRTIREGSQA